MQLRALLVSIPVVMIAVACAPCDPITNTLTAVCHRADAGVMAPDASFILEGESFAVGACEVSVDGGAISLTVSGATTTCSALGAGARAPSAPVKCTIPPLEPGTYTVDSQPALTFTLPSTDGGSVRACN